MNEDSRDVSVRRPRGSSPLDLPGWLTYSCRLVAHYLTPIDNGTFITGSDILMDGGVTASDWYGDLAEARTQQ